MGKINRCLRRPFISLNIKFAMGGVGLIWMALQSSVDSHKISLWLIGIGVFGISCLGIYAGCSEKEILLKIFAGFMGVAMIIMLISGIVMVVKKNKFKSSFDSTESFMKNKELRKKLDGLQQSDHCCGLVGASDWGGNIPSSCECSGYGYGGYGGSECKPKPQGVSGPDRIYAQPCSKVMFMSEDSDSELAMGLCFGLAVFPLLGLLLSHMMIREVEHHDSSEGSSIAIRGS